MKAGNPAGLPGPLVSPLAWLYRLAVWARNQGYDRGWLPCRRLPVPVISIGNLAAGGTGKTPLVMLLARRLYANGYRPAVVLRGYGGRNAGRSGSPALRVMPAQSAGEATGADEAGDEAVLLARELGDLPVIVCADRYRGGRLAIETCGANLILLDDGFQHRRLHRDADLVALDATQPWGNGRLLPAGWLREPASALGRAHAVILTRCEGPETVSHAAASIHDRHPRLAVYRSRHLPVRLHFPADPPRPPLRPEELKGRAVGAFAGLARPDSLRLSLESMGAQVVMFRPLPDHQPFAPGQVKGFLQEAQAAGAELLVTSAKDLARMPPGEVPAELAVLDITLQVEEEAELLALLRRLCGRPALPWETDDGRVEPSP